MTTPVITPDRSAQSIDRSYMAILRTDRFIAVVLLVVGIVLTGLSIARYEAYNAGMLDLGNMSQAIWSSTQGEPLVFTQPERQMSRLQGHVELAYFFITPFYLLWSDPRVLLIIQAVLFIAAALPVYRMTLRATGELFAARAITLIYLFYPVAQTAVLFDFHGDTLAAPLLLFALDALDRQAWRTYWPFIGLALCAKLYVAALVAGIGFYAFVWGGQRRVGVATTLVAVGYGLVAFFLIRPLFAAETATVTTTSVGYLDYYFGNLSQLVNTLGDRLLNAIIVFGPLALIGWRGWRWLLIGMPLALAALLSTGPGAAYGYSHHHYALLVPLLVMAAIDGTRRMQAAAKQRAAQPPPQRARRRRDWRSDLGFTVVLVLLFQIVFVDTPLSPLFWTSLPGRGLDSAAYGITARDGLKDEFLATAVPDDTPLVASMFLAPHVAHRDVVHIVRYPDDPGGERLPRILPRVQYALADALFDWRVGDAQGIAGGIGYEREEIGILLRDPAFGLITARDGLLLFARDADPTSVLTQQVTVLEDAPATPPLATFTAEEPLTDTITLLDAEITPIETASGRRYRATFTWQAADAPSALMPGYVAVSRLAGVDNARMVHLPTFALSPVDEWQPGEVVQETFEVELPADLAPGEYTWQVGWYNPLHFQAHYTDARSRLGDEVDVTTITVE
jgi:uncharacterized membrane protein